jgi:putative FmdB family regulatory protein
MPLYEYQCDACDSRFEVIQKYSDPSVETCRVCGKGPVRRLVSSPAIQFKGSGWYVTDYAKKSSSDTAAGSDGKAADAKAATKSDDSAKPSSSAKSDSSGSTPSTSTTTKE